MEPSKLIQGSKEWLEFRQNKIGASDMASIMGVGFHTPYKLWQVKLGMTEITQTPAMSRGLEMEPAIRRSYETHVGFSVDPEVIQHPEIEWMIASLDGRNAEKKKVAEFKLANRIDHELAKNGIVPDKYYPQLQQQMCCTKYENIDYYSFYDNQGNDAPDTVRLNVNRDDKYIEKIIKAGEAFYECMMNLEPPEMTEADYLKRNDSWWMDISQRWLDANSNFELCKEIKESLRAELINGSDGRSSEGGGVRLRQYFSKGSVQYKKIPELKNVDLDLYRGAKKQSWRLEANGKNKQNP